MAAAAIMLTCPHADGISRTTQAAIAMLVTRNTSGHRLRAPYSLGNHRYCHHFQTVERSRRDGIALIRYTQREQDQGNG